MANPAKSASVIRKASKAAQAKAAAEATAKTAAAAKAAAEAATKTAKTVAKGAPGASAADRAEKLAEAAERAAARHGARKAVADAKAAAQAKAASPSPSPTPAKPAASAKPAAAPGAPGTAPGEDWTFFRNLKQSRGYDKAKWDHMLKDATNPADVQAHARGFGFSMTEDQAKQVLKWRDTQKAGNTPAWQRMTSPSPSPARTPAAPSRGPAPGARGTTPSRTPTSRGSAPAAANPPASAPAKPEGLPFVSSLPFGKGWKAETKGVPRSKWAKAAAAVGAVYAGDKMLNTGMDSGTAGAIADAFTQVPKGPGDSFIGTGLANVAAGLQTGFTGRPSGLAPARGEFDGWSPELVAAMPGVRKSMEDRSRLAAQLKAASEATDMSPEGLSGLLGGIRKSYMESMALTNGLVGAQFDSVRDKALNTYRQRLDVLQTLPAMKNLIQGNADRVAQMAGGLEGSSDLWTDEDRTRVQPYVDWFNKQPIENRVFFDFDGYQKALDSRRAGGK